MTESTRRGRKPQFTDEQIVEMRTAWAHGRRVKDLSDDYCVSEPTISSIVHGKMYKHVPVIPRQVKSRAKDFRYPYTYAGDFFRSYAPSISDREAAQLRQGLAHVLGITDTELAKVLADFEIDKQAAPAVRSWAQRLIEALRLAR